VLGAAAVAPSDDLQRLLDLGGAVDREVLEVRIDLDDRLLWPPVGSVDAGHRVGLEVDGPDLEVGVLARDEVDHLGGATLCCGVTGDGRRAGIYGRGVGLRGGGAAIRRRCIGRGFGSARIQRLPVDLRVGLGVGLRGRLAGIHPTRIGRWRRLSFTHGLSLGGESDCIAAACRQRHAKGQKSPDPGGVRLSCHFFSP